MSVLFYIHGNIFRL